VGAVATVAAAALLFGGVLRDSPSATVGGPRPASAGALLDRGLPAGDTAALVGHLRVTLRNGTGDAEVYARLGAAYQQRARETGDPSFYEKSEQALRRARNLAPADASVLSALGSLALARHRFRQALSLGQRARALAPDTARPYGIVGDALIELGRYREAFRAYDAMARSKPDLASYSRIAHARELLGRPAGAIAAMRRALDASLGRGEPAAWTYVELGKLHFSLGRLGAAATHYRAALAVFPRYASALDALAQVEGARSRYRRAIALERRAVAANPLPEFVGYLSDLYRAAGRPRLARRQYALIRATDRLLVTNGVKTDLETASFNIDHGLDLTRSLALARRARRERPSVEADDVLAWALTRTGRCEEARRYSKRALRLGSLDATALFHRGMLERCLGHADSARAWFARALRVNPHFSLRWAPVARSLSRGGSPPFSA
jgi:tetratricopeptide (TPR) repeat protein